MEARAPSARQPATSGPMPASRRLLGVGSGPRSKTTGVDLDALILDRAADGVVCHTLDGRVLYFNDAAASQLGYSRAEFDALGRFGWVHDDALEYVAARVQMIREHGKLLFASLGAAKDRRLVHTEVNARLVRARGDDLIVAVIRDVTERVIAHEHIRHLAFHDRLTGLANRTRLEDDLRVALAAADRHGDLVGAIYLDLDDFKPVNDELGHAVGDDVLREVSARMRDCVRECDTVARLGGDEFVILVTRVSSREDFATVARKLEEAVEVPIPVGDREVCITASAGLAVYETGEAAEDLVNRADHAMYRAKQAGVPGWEAFLAKG